MTLHSIKVQISKRFTLVNPPLSTSFKRHAERDIDDTRSFRMTMTPSVADSNI